MVPSNVAHEPQCQIISHGTAMLAGVYWSLRASVPVTLALPAVITLHRWLDDAGFAHVYESLVEDVTRMCG